MNQPLFSDIRWFETITSTNDYLKALCRENPTGGLVAAALEQTKGRGRTGRSFCSKTGGVYFSFSLKAPLPAAYIPTITLLAGLAVHDAVTELTGVETQIKWPNDVVCHNKKLCGILTEGTVGSDGRLLCAVVGIGMNLSGSSSDYPEDLREIVGTLEEQGGRTEPKPFVEAVLRRFEALWQGGLFYQNMAAIMAAYSEHLAWRGSDVRLSRGSETVFGRLVGVNDSGELLLFRGGRLEAYPSGEIHLRPVRTCAFSGNRILSHSREAVYTALVSEVENLVCRGFTVFRTGGAGGFDTLAAMAVIHVRKNHPELFLEILLPYPEFAPDDPDFPETIQKADRVTAVSEHYTSFCMSVRNEALVESADLLILYNYQEKGGSVQTSGIAARHRVPVERLSI